MGSRKHKEKSKEEKKEKSERSAKREKGAVGHSSPPPDKIVAEPRERKRKRRDEGAAAEETPAKPSKKIRAERKNEDNAADSETQNAGEMSMSVAESNKLREKLGLAPLQLDDKPKVKEIECADGTMSEEKVYTKEGVEFVHKPAKNLNDAKIEEKLREKLETAKERRKIHEKLSSVKLLSAPTEEDSAAAWVEKSRKVEEERKLAAQRAQILEEMDKDFGIGEILLDQKKAKQAKAYTSKDLKNMTVEHSMENIGEGSETILVLQDKDVLDESEDVLMNPTMKELEHWTKNAEIRKNKPGYDPLMDDFDQFGNYQEKKLLGKYDEEIDGRKKESFRLDSHGVVEDADYRAIIAEKMKAKLREGAQNLDSAPSQLASEFYTKEEMTKFKKSKKKTKKIVRKRGGATVVEASEQIADDLLNSADISNEDFGSRRRGKGKLKQEYEESREDGPVLQSTLSRAAPVDLSSLNVESDDNEEDANYEDLTGVVIDDEAENELQSVLHRSRLIKQMEPSFGEEFSKNDGIAEKLLKSMVKEELLDDLLEEGVQSPDAGAVVLNSISEYCRGLGDIPTYGLAGNRDDFDVTQQQDYALASIKSESMSEDSDDEIHNGHKKSEKRNKWIKAGFDRANISDASSSDDEDGNVRPPILEDEPVASGGVVAALQLARKKGYLEGGDSDNHGPSRLAHLEAQRYTVIDKQFHDIDDKYTKKLERMGGHAGPVSDFKEKSNYKPNVKLEYSDKKGNLMNPKDAFRGMSWKFHGKNPGREKTQKRINKQSKKHMLNQMSSVDTPLGTLGMQIDKQKQLSLPYIVLSGAGSKDMTSIKKD